MDKRQVQIHRVLLELKYIDTFMCIILYSKISDTETFSIISLKRVNYYLHYSLRREEGTKDTVVEGVEKSG